MAGKVLLMGLLGVCSLEDIRRKEIQVRRLFIFGIIGVLLHMWYQEHSIYDLLLAALVGVVVMLLSLLTKGNVGMGDGLILVITGIYLGLEKNIELFLLGLFFCGIFAVALLLLCQKEHKYEIPFVPFLLIAYVSMLGSSL